jgi:hypothetical protein
MREPKKLNSQKTVAAYHQGVHDRLARKPPRPPKSGDARKAYNNGYHNK